MVLQTIIFIVLNGLALDAQEQEQETQHTQQNSTYEDPHYHLDDDSAPATPYKQPADNNNHIGPIVDIQWQHTLDKLRLTFNESSAAGTAEYDAVAAEEHNLGTRAEQPYPLLPLRP